MTKLHPFNSIASFVFNFIATTFLIVMLVVNPEATSLTLAFIMLIVSACTLSMYVLERMYLKGSLLYHAITQGAMFIAAAIFLFVPVSEATVCLVWAILDIAYGIFYGITSFFAIKGDKLKIEDFILAIGYVVFGTIFLFKVLDGLPVHLIYYTCALFIEGVFKVIEFVISRKYKENPMVKYQKD